MICNNNSDASTQDEAVLEARIKPRLSEGFTVIWKVLAGMGMILTITYFFAEWEILMCILIGLVITFWSDNPLFRL